MTHDDVTDIERRYLLQKRGLYYRPDRCGYTGIKEHAGRYFEHEASLPDVVAIHEDEAAEFSPSCYDDLARQHLQEQNASLRKQLEKFGQLYTLQTTGHKLTRFQGVSYVCSVQSLFPQ